MWRAALCARLLRAGIALGAAALGWSAPAAAERPCGRPVQVVDQVRLQGNSRTADATLLALLPRRAPARYSAEELADFERRLNNLGIFDHVGVSCEGAELRVSVREKWTLVPEIDFASGQTFEDSYLLLGATEYNLLGTANQLGLNVYREQRGFGFGLVFSEHEYKRRGWALYSELAVGTAAVRLPEGGGWRTTSTNLQMYLRSPPWLHEYFTYVAGVYGSYDSVRGGLGPASTQLVQSFMGFSWDGYEWHDLVPRGLRASLWLSVGGSFGGGPPEPRHSAELSIDVALPLGPSTVLSHRMRAIATTRGNVNYGFLLGSVGGVRGLLDAYYFNWLHAVSNWELRQSLRLGGRWAVQGVAFVDAAAFEPLDAAGGRTRAETALSVGGGARLVPTWLSTLVLRLDVARALAPRAAWFAQVGLNQYF